MKTAPKSLPSDEGSKATLVTEQTLSDILEQHFGDVRLPDPNVWTYAASQIRQFQRKPWTDEDSAKFSDGVRRMKAEREVLHKAAKILEADAKRFFPNNPYWQQRYADAIHMLRSPRGIVDTKHGRLHKISNQGPNMMGWTFVSKEILAWIVPILMRYEAPISSSPTSPLVKSLRTILCTIYRAEDVRAASTISKVVADYLGT